MIIRYVHSGMNQNHQSQQNIDHVQKNTTTLKVLQETNAQASAICSTFD